MKDKQETFLQLFEPVRENLWRFCLSVTLSRENAKDLLQQTIETAYRQFDSLQSRQAFLSYLFTIASRTNSRNNYRDGRTGRLDADALATIVSEDFPPDRLYDIRLLYLSLDKLPPEQKEAVILKDISGFSQKEICTMQGVSPDSLQQRLYRGRKKLKALMADGKAKNYQYVEESISTKGGYNG